MKKIYQTIILLLSIALFANCVSKKDKIENHEITDEKDLIVIENDSLEYKVIIFEPGFNSWLNSSAKPRNFYDQSFLEQRNRIWVQEYNVRVQQPMRYSPDLYPFAIEYRFNIDYGYEVNYLLYNYFLYFQNQNKQKLGTFIPRI